MVAGRPRTHDRDQVAIDLVEWAKQPDSINLNKFCSLYDPIISPSYMTIWARECPKFRQAYEAAKAFIGWRREEKLNKNELHVKAYDLNATTYDYFLKEEKRAQAEYEANLKKVEEQKAQQIIVKVQNDGLGSGLNISAEALPNPPSKGS